MDKREIIRDNIAFNITALRTDRGLTQLELAEKLNYSDKAVSKWERAESLPDITVLVQIADYFDVNIQYLLEKDHPASTLSRKAVQHETRRNHATIIGMSILLIWLIASVLFVILRLSSPGSLFNLLPFIYAVPLSAIVWLVLNTVWFSPRNLFLIVSLLLWTLLAAIFLHFLIAGKNIWLIFILGIPGQIIILLSSRLNYRETRLWRQTVQRILGHRDSGGPSST